MRNMIFFGKKGGNWIDEMIYINSPIAFIFIFFAMVTIGYI